MPLTDTGYVPMDYEEWLLAIQQKLQQDLGNDIDLSTGSFLESFAEALARQLERSDLTKQDLYDSRFVSLAEGVSLDRLAANNSISRGVAAYAEADLVITGTPGYVIDAETMFSNNQDRIYLTEEETTIGLNGTVTIKVHAEDVGEEYNCDANTITDQVMYVEEIESVTNPESASGGADMEADYDLRKRVRLAQQSIKSPTPNGIANALFELPGVKSVRYIVNGATPQITDDPPYTTHLFVLGGVLADVAQTISDWIAAGIILTGSQKYDIPLINGDVNHVAFSVGQSQTIYMNLSVELEDSDELSIDTVTEDIRDNILAWLDEFSMGDKLKYTQLFGIIYEVDGVSNVTNLTWGTDKDNLTRTDIHLENFSVAISNDDAIGVVING